MSTSSLNLQAVHSSLVVINPQGGELDKQAMLRIQGVVSHLLKIKREPIYGGQDLLLGLMWEKPSVLQTRVLYEGVNLLGILVFGNNVEQAADGKDAIAIKALEITKLAPKRQQKKECFEKLLNIVKEHVKLNHSSLLDLSTVISQEENEVRDLFQDCGFRITKTQKSSRYKEKSEHLLRLSN